MNKKISLIIFVCVMILSGNSSAIAQQFTPLTSTSSYACIKFPSGKFGVGKASKSGYAVRSFSVASKEISTTLSNKRTQLKTRQMLLNDFAKDNDISKSQVQSIIASQVAFGVSQNLIDKVIKFNLLLNNLRNEISLLNDELSSLKDCQKGKTEFKSVSTAKAADILAQNATQIVLSSLLEVDYPGKYESSLKVFFCILKEGESTYRLSAAYKNPCSESVLGGVFEECLAPSNKLHMPLVLSYLASNVSQQFINSTQVDIDTQYNGNYTLKSISDNPNSPCGYLNK